jgi:predicted dehydrogenase
VRSRVAIVGSGFGVRTQLPAFRAAGGWEVVSLTGADLAKTRRLAEANGVPHALASIEEAVRVGDPHLVCVSTPPALHHPMGAAVLHAARHCLLEKPMALDAGEAADLVARAEEVPRLALVDHELRALPNRQELRRRLAAGDAGRPLHAHVRFTSQGRAAPGVRWGWFARRRDGGGILGAIGSHVVDSLVWWLGEITRVRARLTTSITQLPDGSGAQREVETDDGAELLVRFRSGATGTITLNAVASRYEGIEWWVHGTEGSLGIRENGALVAQRRGRDGEEDLSIDDGLGAAPLLDGTQWARGFVRLAGDLHRAVRDGEVLDHAATFADGLRTQRVLDAARLSDAREGAEVDV